MASSPKEKGRKEGKKEKNGSLGTASPKHRAAHPQLPHQQNNFQYTHTHAHTRTQHTCRPLWIGGPEMWINKVERHLARHTRTANPLWAASQKLWIASRLFGTNQSNGDAAFTKLHAYSRAHPRRLYIVRHAPAKLLLATSPLPLPARRVSHVDSKCYHPPQFIQSRGCPPQSPKHNKVGEPATP